MKPDFEWLKRNLTNVLVTNNGSSEPIVSTVNTTAPSGRTFFGHPRGLSTLFFTEMWERFSYYGMRALLTLFMTTATIESNPGMGFDVATAGAIYGMYTALVYITALPGGWIADNLWGQRKSIWVGGWIIAIGHFTMAIPVSYTHLTLPTIYSV